MSQEILEQERRVWQLEGSLTRLLQEQGIPEIVIILDPNEYYSVRLTRDGEWYHVYGGHRDRIEDPSIVDFVPYYAIYKDLGYYNLMSGYFQQECELADQMPPDESSPEDFRNYSKAQTLLYQREKEECQAYESLHFGELASGFLDSMEALVQGLSS